MNIDNRWLVLLAVALGVAVGVSVASKSRRRVRRTARDREHGTQLKSWENEGGNLAPTAVASASS